MVQCQLKACPHYTSDVHWIRIESRLRASTPNAHCAKANWNRLGSKSTSSIYGCTLIGQAAVHLVPLHCQLSHLTNWGYSDSLYIYNQAHVRHLLWNMSTLKFCVTQPFLHPHLLSVYFLSLVPIQSQIISQVKPFLSALISTEPQGCTHHLDTFLFLSWLDSSCVLQVPHTETSPLLTISSHSLFKSHWQAEITLKYHLPANLL